MIINTFEIPQKTSMTLSNGRNQNDSELKNSDNADDDDQETLFNHDGVFSRAGGVMYLEIKNK